METLKDILKKTLAIAIYGLSLDTKEFINKYEKKANIICLLDGFQKEGEMYGYPIFSLEKAISEGISRIIVVARPASRMTIINRIGEVCRNNSIELFDVDGNDLLNKREVLYSFNKIEGASIADLLDLADRSDVISFDLFDTLVVRKAFDYTDVFSILENNLLSSGINIPNFVNLRISTELEMPKNYAPDLKEIYSSLLKKTDNCNISASDLSEMEWRLDFSLLMPRYSVCKIYRELVNSDKKIVITTDSYYHENQIKKILQRFDLMGYDNIFISCEYKTSKKFYLFEKMIEKTLYSGNRILHIGDNASTDISRAMELGINTYRIYSCVDLFYNLGGLGFENKINCLSDRIKAGLFISKIFNNPFVLDSGQINLSVTNSFDIGYLFFSPIITDFVLWINDRINHYRINNVLFSARDGYLIQDLYNRIDDNTKSYYFLTSRMASIRAGLKSVEDINAVDNIPFSGTSEEKDKIRFGIDSSEFSSKSEREDVILKHSALNRENYLKYINKLNLDKAGIALYDFVAKGTIQKYLQRLFNSHLKGLYFMQLDNNYAITQNIDIESFYYGDNKNFIYEIYQLLETILMSPNPSVEEFDENGNPIYAKEIRTKVEINCIKQIQAGIKSYFEDLVKIIDKTYITVNKDFDEYIASLIRKVSINDEAFLSLKFEDKFYGRIANFYL